MTAYSRSAWESALLSWAITAALACGSSGSKSNNASDAASADFGNVPTHPGGGSGHQATSPKDAGSRPANSGSGPTNSGGGPQDSGTAAAMDSGHKPPPPPSGPFDSGPLDASTDVSSNDEWIGAVKMRVDMAARSGCDKPLARDAKLDAVAQQLAEDPNAQIDLKTRSMWKTVTAFKLDSVLSLINPYVDENATICTWHSYGIGIVGAPGGNRRIVLLLAE